MNQPSDTAGEVKVVNIEFACPACGAEGYEQEMDADDVAKAAQVSFRCDECPATIYVEADVRLSATVPSAAVTQ